MQSHSVVPGWVRIHCVAQAGLKFTVILMFHDLKVWWPMSIRENMVCDPQREMCCTLAWRASGFHEDWETQRGWIPGILNILKVISLTKDCSAQTYSMHWSFHIGRTNHYEVRQDEVEVGAGYIRLRQSGLLCYVYINKVQIKLWEEFHWQVINSHRQTITSKTYIDMLFFFLAILSSTPCCILRGL